MRRSDASVLVLSQLIPRSIDETVDLRDADPLTLLAGAARTMWVDGDRFIRVIGVPYADTGTRRR
jgi:hypothetical protein